MVPVIVGDPEATLVRLLSRSAVFMRPEKSLHALNTQKLETPLRQADSRLSPAHPAVAPFWLAGGALLPWARLFLRNRRGTTWKCLPALVLTAPLSLISSGLGFVQQLVYGRRVAQTPIKAPIFIIGHWRSGTTLLHNLLALDSRHAAPNGYECIFPSHFLLTERWMLRILDWLPSFRRPMDDMLISPHSPQEDELALSLLGQPSSYLHLSFPNHSMPDPAYYDVESFATGAREAWKKTLFRFLQQLTWRHGRRMVLKSPAHSLRIRLLLELFPDARFIHIVRNPYEVFPSTMRMNNALLRFWAVQETTEGRLEEQVFDRGALLYERLEKEKGLVPPNRFHEMRYEDLVRDPVGQLRQLYSQLKLPGFDEVQPKIEQHMAQLAGYVSNKHELDERLRDEITRRWRAIIDRYGYSPPANNAVIQNAESSIP
jgi:hypothetical protein